MRSPDRIRTVARRAASAATRLGGALLVLLAVALVAPGSFLAATPTPDPLGDPRSAGQGPGLVGDPMAAILGVVAIALLTVALTLAYVRATGGREGRRGS